MDRAEEVVREILGGSVLVNVRVIRTIGEFAGLPLGSRIATNHNKLLISEEFAGRVTWSEYGELSVYTPIIDWLPAYVLPPVVDHRSDEPWP